MRGILCSLFALCLLFCAASALGVPQDVIQAAPEGASEYTAEFEDQSGPQALDGGIRRIWEDLRRQCGAIFRQRLRGAVSVLTAVILCSGAKGLLGDREGGLLLPMAGALAVTALAAGSLDYLIGLGWDTIRDLDRFSKALLPALAAATAASGAVTTATFQQVATVFLSELLVGWMSGVLMPVTYLYIGVLTASCALAEDRLALLAAGLKKIVTSLLTGSLLLFTVYLSVSRVITGSVDAAAVRTAKAAVSNVVPVVGGILAEAAEAVLAGAGTLRASLGVFGMVAILGACVYPFLQLGIQYLLYKAAALLASCVGMPELCRLLDGLGGAFGLVLGMTGSCALLLLVSVLSFVSAVTP